MKNILKKILYLLLCIGGTFVFFLIEWKILDCLEKYYFIDNYGVDTFKHLFALIFSIFIGIILFIVNFCNKGER